MTNFIKSKTKSEWCDTYRSYVNNFYNAITDDGERGLIAGLIGGIIIVLLFKYVFILAVIVASCALLIWALADTDKEEVQAEETIDVEKSE